MKRRSLPSFRFLVCLLVLLFPAAGIHAQPRHDFPDRASVGEQMMNKARPRQQLTLLVDEQDLADRINRDWAASRGILETGATALKKAAKGQLSSAIVTLVAGGVTDLYKLMTVNKTKRENWLSAVRQSNVWTDSLRNNQGVNDFYRTISKLGALDPSDMQFNGFDFLEMDGDDVLYRIRCTIDTSATGIYEIINHGKFRLQLDSLFIDPFVGHIPNALQRDKSYPFEFEEGADEVRYSFGFTIRSSWMTEAIEYFKDIELGRFRIDITLKEASLNADGPNGRKVYVYSRQAGLSQVDAPAVVGESLIVPRSYLGISHNDFGYSDNIWSTGEFDVCLTIDERRTIGNDYWKSRQDKPRYWKTDYKKRMGQKAVPFSKWVTQELSRINGQTVITSIVTSTTSAILSDALGIEVQAKGTAQAGSQQQPPQK